MQTIISALVIIHCVQFCHPKSRRCMHCTRSFVVVNVAYIPKISIHCLYHVVIVICRISKIQVRIIKTEDLVKWIISYLKHIKTMWCCMSDVTMQQHLTWPWIQSVNIHNPNMHWHTGNVCCVVVTIDHILKFQDKNQISIIPTHLLQ